MGGRSEGRLDRLAIAEPVDEAFVVRCLVPQRGRVRRIGGRSIGVGRQRRVVDRDRFGRILGLIERLGDDHRHRLADMAGAAVRQRQERRSGHCPAVAAPEHDLGRDRAVARGGVIGAGQHRQHARHDGGRGGVDRADVRMRMGRAQEMRAHRPRRGDVINIASAARQQPPILGPRDRIAYVERTHRASPDWRSGVAAPERSGLEWSDPG